MVYEINLNNITEILKLNYLLHDKDAILSKKSNNKFVITFLSKNDDLKINEIKITDFDMNSNIDFYIFKFKKNKVIGKYYDLDHAIKFKFQIIDIGVLFNKIIIKGSLYNKKNMLQNKIIITTIYLNKNNKIEIDYNF